MDYSKGELFHIATKSGIYQVLGLYGRDDKGALYYFRKVFDGKLKLKVSKAELVHESRMAPIGAKVRDELEDSLCIHSGW